MLLRLVIGIIVLIAIGLTVKFLPEFKRTASNTKSLESSNSESPREESDGIIRIDWRILRELNLETGLPTAKLSELQGRKIRIPGFVVPLEDAAREVSEFLFVPTFQACIHVPPPPPNQMIYVKMQNPVQLDWNFRAFWLEGILRIQLKMSAYGAVSYEMEGLRLTPYRKE